MPRHLYGELARTLEGCAHLARRNITMDLVSSVRSSYVLLITSSMSNTASSATSSAPTSPSKQGDPALGSVAAGAGRYIGHNTIELRSNLWSIAHIAATEFGFNAIMNADPFFVEWCIEGACSSPFFSLRATFFYVLGLISRTVAGSHKLNHLRWDCVVHGSNSAVALPRDPGTMFRKLTSPLPPAPLAKRDTSGNMRTTQLSLNTTVPLSVPVFGKSPVLQNPLSLTLGADLMAKEQEVLHIICKVTIETTWCIYFMI